MPAPSVDLFGDPCDPTLRVCVVCKQAKPPTEFRTTAMNTGRRINKVRRWNRCIPCMRAACRAYVLTARGQLAVKKSKLKRYGLTLADFDRMRAEQGGACSVCGAREEDLPIDPRTGKKYELAVDHCHASGKVRSLLCPLCNNGLGCFKDDPGRLRAAIAYLARHGVTG